MTTQLDVLLIESRQRAADEAEAVLRAAGHRVRRCYGPDDLGFPCTAIRDPGTCPLDHGVDGAVLVRAQMSPRPTPLEAGVNCAVRAGVPVVEQGPATLDPYDPWLALRSDGEDIAQDVAVAVRSGLDAFARDVLARARTVIPDLADAAALGCRFERRGPDLQVHLSGPALGRQVERDVAVRALDAVRSSDRSFRQVDVTYHPVQ